MNPFKDAGLIESALIVALVVFVAFVIVSTFAS